MKGLISKALRQDDGRLGRAVAGLVVRRVVRREKELVAEVVSRGARGERVYGVAISRRRWFCSCADYRKRGALCKHVLALALHELGEAAAAHSERREPGVPVQR